MDPHSIQLQLPQIPRRSALLLCAVVAALLLVSGCGRSGSKEDPPPHGVPPGDVAIVGSAAVNEASFGHWLPILRRARGPAAAREATVTFLIKAQWLTQEAEAEGINHSVLNKLVAQRAAAPTQSQPGMTRADRALQARLDIIFQALRKRHSQAPGEASAAAVARYYATHRAEFTTPAVRHTLMVVTHTAAAALKARSALARGRPWATVAKRWSVDSSAALGGAFAIVRGVSPPALVHAAFNAPRGRLLGPLHAPPLAGAPVRTYYLFRVTKAEPATPQSRAEVAPQIRQTLTELSARHAWAAFVRSYEHRWRQRTLCAPGYLAPECRNYRATGR